MSVFEAVFNNPYLCREIAQWDPVVFNKVARLSKVFAKSLTRANMAVCVVWADRFSLLVQGREEAPRRGRACGGVRERVPGLVQERGAAPGRG